VAPGGTWLLPGVAVHLLVPDVDLPRVLRRHRQLAAQLSDPVAAASLTSGRGGWRGGPLRVVRDIVYANVHFDRRRF